MLGDIWTVFWRDWLVLRHRMKAFILKRMVAPILYLVAFGWGLGGTIRPETGTSYIDFLVPGIIALNSMNISYGSVLQVHAERIFYKSIEEYMIAPIARYSFVIGKVLAAVLRALISSAIIISLAYAFGARFFITPFFLLVLILNCAVFASVGFITSVLFYTDEQLMRVNTYILLPMSFFCGTFFSTRVLPDALRYFIEMLPLTHASYLLRGIARGESVSLLSVGVLVAYLVGTFAVAEKLYRRMQVKGI